MKMKKHEDGAEYHNNITQDDLSSDGDMESTGDWGRMFLCGFQRGFRLRGTLVVSES